MHRRERNSDVQILREYFALGASIELMQSIGMANIQARALELNRKLTTRLSEIGWKVLSPLDHEDYRSAETLVAADNPADVVRQLAEQKILVTEKPRRVSRCHRLL